MQIRVDVGREYGIERTCAVVTWVREGTQVCLGMCGCTKDAILVREGKWGSSISWRRHRSGEHLDVWHGQGRVHGGLFFPPSLHFPFQKAGKWLLLDGEGSEGM